MKTTKIYATLTNAYAAAERAKAVPFIVNRSYEEMVIRALDRAHMTASKRNLAVCNLVQFKNILCALEETKDGFRWTAIGTFDSDGLLYPISTGAPHVASPKRVCKGKGNGVDFSKVEGKTKSARNKSAHKLILAIGVKSGSDEYKKLWEQWTKVR